MEQVLTIEVLGQPFTFKTDSDESNARAVADFVVKSVDQAKKQCAQKTLSPDKGAILILTALNIANEYFDLRQKHQKLMQDMSKRSTNLLNSLESQLA